MHVRHIVLAVLAAAVTLTSVAAAGPSARKQRVAIYMKIVPREFVLYPLQSGALKRDAGRITELEEVSGHRRIVIRDGQRVTIDHPTIWKLDGQRGTLTIRERNEWVLVGSDLNGDRFRDAVAFGTWKVVRGSGQYAKIAGGGRSVHLGLGRVWVARQEGLLTLR